MNKKQLAVLLLLCAIGSVLTGLNAGRLNERLNICLFAAGIALTGFSVTQLGIRAGRSLACKKTLRQKETEKPS